ncbi:hypothetical protein [Seleniivibrio woodruffii]|uniref:Uncharacterized protein n=1 Tax=Seleniivibrio woodruffii TaxID=1078050 RepID=A0A4R1KC82_9BACT|nr:hypothetical protein [Seleniivibrio woodruffii]TCK60749.1 hypothetical protein C8D98_1628 [Seleniivibrio woodruffii]TVZ36379.1 hypothetical protein OF66_2004 [Seleniivibrio woodruffii]
MSGFIHSEVIANLESIDREMITIQASMTIDSLLDELYTLSALEESGEFWLSAANDED